MYESTGEASDGAAFHLVRDGRSVATIVVPAQPLPVETYAAQELQYHVEAATGARLPIVTESDDLPAGARVYLGNCEAARVAVTDPSALPGNGYVLRVVGEDLYVTGRDGEGDPLALRTHAGTLFAVYDLLEEHFGVRWLWPGRLGEVIPHRQDLSVPASEKTVEPRLLFQEWRGGRNEGERAWLRRHRFHRGVDPSYRHAFTAYWPRFGATHPEYFAMLPDGTRRLHPDYEGEHRYIHMCLSEPALWHQIIEDWKAEGAPEFLNVSENDGWAGCACPTCLSWDEPDPENPVPFDQRLESARRVLDGVEEVDVFGRPGDRCDWVLKLGSLSDRYARFWATIHELASKIRPDVKVFAYAYANYREPPRENVRLHRNIVLGMVPDAFFPYNEAESRSFRAMWTGWARTGCSLFLRPNLTLQAPGFPVFYARVLGEDVSFAASHAMVGADFDSLTSFYSTQGPTLYVLPRILQHPDLPVDVILGEFYAAFGQAEQAVREYCAHWEAATPAYPTADHWRMLRARWKYGGRSYGPFYTVAAQVFSPQVMREGQAILARARRQALGDAQAEARVEWLAKGLRHTELILAGQQAYEHAVDTGDRTRIEQAIDSLRRFRAENVGYDAANFAGLHGEEGSWERVPEDAPPIL
jgi:hypothetical protein